MYSIKQPLCSPKLAPVKTHRRCATGDIIQTHLSYGALSPIRLRVVCGFGFGGSPAELLGREDGGKKACFS